MSQLASNKNDRPCPERRIAGSPERRNAGTQHRYQENLTAELLAGFQFAFTVSFPIVLPAFLIALASFLTVPSAHWVLDKNSAFLTTAFGVAGVGEPVKYAACGST